MKMTRSRVPIAALLLLGCLFLAFAAGAAALPVSTSSDADSVTIMTVEGPIHAVGADAQLPVDSAKPKVCN